MKKLLMALLCVLLTLAMVLSLAACGEDSKKKRSRDDDDEDEEKEGTSDVGENDEEDEKDEGEDEKDEEEAKTPAELIVGTWEGKMDLGTTMSKTYQALGMDITMPSAKVTITLTFGKDGSYRAEYNDSEMNNAARRCGEAIVEQLARSYGMSEADFLEESGYADRDEFVEDFMEGFGEGMSIVGDGTGTYEIKNGDLYRWVADVEAVAEPFTVSSTQLKLLFPEDALNDLPEESRELTRAILEAQYPLVLTRK